MLLVLNRRRVVPLYTKVDAQRLTESRLAHRQCVWLGDYLYMPYNTSLARMAVYFYGPRVALGPLDYEPPSSMSSWASYHESP